MECFLSARGRILHSQACVLRPLAQLAVSLTLFLTEGEQQGLTCPFLNVRLNNRLPSGSKNPTFSVLGKVMKFNIKAYSNTACGFRNSPREWSPLT